MGLAPQNPAPAPVDSPAANRKASSRFKAVFSLIPSCLLLAVSLAFLDGIQQDRFSLGIIERVVKANTYLNSDEGKEILPAVLTLAGTIFGILTAMNTRYKSVFWFDIVISLSACAIIAYVLIEATPPVSNDVGTMLEGYGIVPSEKPLSALLSLFLATGATWTVNRITKFTSEKG